MSAKRISTAILAKGVSVLRTPGQEKLTVGNGSRPRFQGHITAEFHEKLQALFYAAASLSAA
jgi:hypothetical protein